MYKTPFCKSGLKCADLESHCEEHVEVSGGEMIQEEMVALPCQLQVLEMVSHSKIEKLYALNTVELISLTWDYCYIMSVSFTVPGRINAK